MQVLRLRLIRDATPEKKIMVTKTAFLLCLAYQPDWRVPTEWIVILERQNPSINVLCVAQNTLSHIWSLNIRRMRFLNYIKLVDLLILRLCKGNRGSKDLKALKLRSIRSGYFNWSNLSHPRSKVIKIKQQQKKKKNKNWKSEKDLLAMQRPIVSQPEKERERERKESSLN